MIEAEKRMLERGKMTKEEIMVDLNLPLDVVESLENDLKWIIFRLKVTGMKSGKCFIQMDAFRCKSIL